MFPDECQPSHRHHHQHQHHDNSRTFVGGGGGHHFALKTTKTASDVRTMMSSCLGSEDPDDYVFGSSGAGERTNNFGTTPLPQPVQWRGEWWWWNGAGSGSGGCGTTSGRLNRNHSSTSSCSSTSRSSSSSENNSSCSNCSSTENCSQLLHNNNKK
ncbi:hypothetical protein Ocin01_02694 [Orchesella cincta]|uniref:Uncharacterized protein n=1 Tax=Orchesella cincta TaxID=48709 RepID=A0A1D2NFC7_ORCCI|nr:hypothetical protein Ocin01_02694 [Orchesella cincta]